MDSASNSPTSSPSKFDSSSGGPPAHHHHSKMDDTTQQNGKISENNGHSSSSDHHHKKHKKHKSHKSSDREKNRDRDRERDREREHKKDRHHSDKKHDRDRDRSHKKDKEKERNHSSVKDPSSPKKEPSSPKKEISSSHEYKIKPEPSSPVKTPTPSPTKAPVKYEDDSSDDDVPLSQRKQVKIKVKKEESSSDDDIPLSQRKKIKVTASSSKNNSGSRKRQRTPEDSESEFEDRKKKKSTTKRPSSSSPQKSPTKRQKTQEEPEEVWEWWKEERRNDGFKWKTLEHKGPVFAPPYERLPKSVHFRYNGKIVELSEEAEEVAGFYSRFIEHDYTTKEKFNTNFFKDWRKVMTKSERELITDLKKCDFKEINDYYKMKSEERKAMSKEEKNAIKVEKEQIQKEYGICIIDGHKEKIGNFNIEPPGLFRGRGEHPKMGMLKKRIQPEDIIINCSKDSKWPVPPPGHKWKEIRHDNEVSWLANWTENIQGQGKYIMLNPTSRLKGEKDWLKYEKARELSKHIDKIRNSYRDEWHSKEMRVRQRAVAMYFIDKLALRAGNEKDEDQADTVGCCSLRFEHIKLHSTLDNKSNVVVFDFLGKDSIRYYNEVEVEKRVFKNLKLFMEHKKTGDDLFDRLNTGLLNKHLSELMDGLSAKVFRTYNASHTLQQQLNEMTPKNGTVAEKLLAYNRANRAVAVLCNHQRAVPKSHEKSMENLHNKIDTKRDEIKKLKKELKGMEKRSKDYEKKHATLKRLEEQLAKLEMNRTDKEEGKEIALGTSKLNYLDPRISVAWCKKHDVPFEKVYNKTQRAKFRWAIDMADKHFKFD